jgi:hypothetical protein
MKRNLATRAVQLGLSTLGIVLIVLLLMLLFGGLPMTGFHSYGWGPSGVFGFLLLVVLILIITERL